MALNDATSSAPLRVLAVVEWYPPAYKAGGPIRSVYNLIQLLNAQTSHPLEVVCGPRDLGDEEPLAGIVCDTPHDQNGVRVTYASSLSLAWWRAKLRGTADAPAPDVRNGNLLFDSTVNSVQDPQIFVTYHDAQAYPEYIVKFKQ